MKVSRISLILFFSIFILTTLFTLSFNSASDGNDEIGFPFRFYEYLGGRRFPEPSSRYLITYKNLIADILLIAFVSILLENFIRTIRKVRK